MFKVINRKGQTLIEVVLAVSVAVIVVYALVALATIAMTYAQSAIKRTEATKLANAGMEAFRLERDARGFNGVCMNLGTYRIKPPDIAAPCVYIQTEPHKEIITLGNITYFRQMEISGGGSIKNIKVIVSWNEGSTERHVSMTGILSDWR